MKEKLKILYEYMVLAVTGGTIYYTLECIFKKSHTSHWSMALLAAIVFICIGLINEVYTYEMPFLFQCLVGAIFIATPLEYVFGLIFNADYSIWDYRGVWGTLHFLDDQCNVLFIFIWIVLAGVCIVLDDWIRWKFFGEEKPHYFLI